MLRAFAGTVYVFVESNEETTFIFNLAVPYFLIMYKSGFGSNNKTWFIFGSSTLPNIFLLPSLLIADKVIPSNGFFFFSANVLHGIEKTKINARKIEKIILADLFIFKS